VQAKRQNSAEALNMERGQLYRWRDAAGCLHFQTDPPPADTPVVVILYVRRQVVDAPAAVEQSSPTNSFTRDIGSIPDLMSVYTPTGFDDLLRCVEEIALRLRVRDKNLETLEDQLWRGRRHASRLERD
jgi:hypothetical protein